MNAPLTFPRSTGSYAERLAAVMPLIPQIESIIAEIFPGPTEMEIEEDPEIDGYRYLSFRVETSENWQEVLARHLRWCERKRQLLGDNSDLVCLDAIPLE